MPTLRYPRTHETLRRDCTTDPIYLFQRRRLAWSAAGVASMGWKYDHEQERMVDDKGRHVTDEKAIEAECATVYWDTERVFLTREEGDDYGTGRAYNYPGGWRVYCVPASGDLVQVLADVTEGGRYR